MPDEMRKTFHKDLDDVRRDLVRMSVMATEMMTLAAEALLGGDLALCQAIIDDDDEVDVLCSSIDERCFRLLALQSPMAADLRILAASMRVNSDLERSADLAVNIVKGARRIYGQEIPPRVRGVISLMSDEAVRMIRLAMEAYIEVNGALGAALHDIDDRFDQLQVQFVEAMFEAHGAQALPLQPAIQLALIARYFERIGDHAVNIGERVSFMASGDQPEHPGAARLRARRGEVQPTPAS